MAIPAEFQEREYESLFIQDINSLGGFTWSPGQTDENLLGFDAGMWLAPSFLLRFGFKPGFDHKRDFKKRVFYRFYQFWPWLAYPYFKGEELSKNFLPEWKKFADDFFPKRALNFFAQHKRPYQSTKQGAAGDHWKSAYFEFRIDQNQQQRLAELEQKLGESSVVTYSCAAFMKRADLWECAENKQILGNTNFVSPTKLNGHTRYTFTEPGHDGFANTEPTPIEGDPIASKLRQAAESEEASFTQLAKTAGNAVAEVMAEEGRETKDGALYFQLTSRMHERFGISDLDEGEESGTALLRAITNVMAFNTINSTSWAIISPPKEFLDE